MLSPSFCHSSRHDSSHYARTHYFQNQFKGLIKPTPGRASPPTTHHGMLNHGSQETWRSETFLQVSNKQMGKIHIFINIFMNNNNYYYYYYYLLKFINNLLYDTYDMIWYVHIRLRTLTVKFTCRNFEIIIISKLLQLSKLYSKCSQSYMYIIIISYHKYHIINC